MLSHFFKKPAVLIGLGLVFIFAKIYQHNLVINLIYEKQRLAKTKAILQATKNQLVARYLTLKNYKNIQTKARNQWGMNPLNIDQVITLTTQTTTQFFTTTNQKNELKKPDSVLTYTTNS